MDKMSRRSFFKVAGATAAATALDAHAARPGKQPVRFTFLQPDEARFIEAACERLIPADENSAGAIEAGVPSYIDKQLAGAWGAGERLGTRPGDLRRRTRIEWRRRGQRQWSIRQRRRTR